MKLTVDNKNYSAEIELFIDWELLEENWDCYIDYNMEVTAIIEDDELLTLIFGDTNCSVTYDLGSQKAIMSDGIFDEVELLNVSYTSYQQVA